MTKRDVLKDYCGKNFCGDCPLHYDFACPLLGYRNWKEMPDDLIDDIFKLLQEAGEIPSNAPRVDTIIKSAPCPVGVTVKKTELTDECIQKIAEAVVKKLKREDEQGCRTKPLQ